VTVNAGKDSEGMNLWNDRCVVDVGVFCTFSPVVEDTSPKEGLEQGIVNKYGATVSVVRATSLNLRV